MSGNSIDLDFDIPTTGLSDGNHKLYIRVINTDNSWSLYDQNVFYVSENNANAALITAAEYFFDIDPGIGNGTPIDLDDSVSIDEDLSVDVPVDLPDGDHFLYIRVQNTDGTWSLYATTEMFETLSDNEFAFEEFRYFPNPVKDVLNIDTNQQVISDLKIIDLHGRVVVHQTPGAHQIDLSQLESGTYLIYLTTHKGSISKKIIKQ
ncbi:MAG: T9SS type A sorting domain-containing protein [Psychroserpens sp.]|nr:T9SS type A sorting domain-containing protein [Psychroserpens sp.]